MFPRGVFAGRLGFTLVEMLLVIALFTLVAGIVFPMVHNQLRESQISSATWSVATALEQARSRGLMDLVVPIATFTYGVGQYEVGSRSFLMDSGCVVTWAGGSLGDQKAVEFGPLGQLLPDGSPAEELVVSMPQIGGIGRIDVSASGLISWTTGN
jgi:prepilin-type N-terminal cleavage/methylation domain-containing protein